MGRIASVAAKQALLGKEIVILNCAEAIITGNKTAAIEKYLHIKQLGGSSQRGPYLRSAPERMMKRVVRGMLPYRKGKGGEALKRIKCYNEVPEEYKDKVKVPSKINPGTSLSTISARIK